MNAPHGRPHTGNSSDTGTNYWDLGGDPFEHEETTAAWDAVSAAFPDITAFISGTVTSPVIPLDVCVGAFHGAAVAGQIALSPQRLAAALSFFEEGPFADRSGETFISDVCSLWRECIDHARERATRQARLGIWDAGDDDYAIPPRGWLLGTAFCRRFLSSLIADGGVGKTALRVAQLISLAIGRSLTGEHVFVRCRVLILSLEDDKDELRRRVFAVMRHHGIRPAYVKGWLFLAAPRGLRLAEMRDGSPQLGEMADLLTDAIDTHHIDIVSIDPFVKSHGMEENNNNAIDFVCTLMATIAIQKDCAVDTPHHTAKGINAAGDASKGRGASSMKDAARLVYTITPMSEDEAKQFGITEADRRSLIRLDSGKVNIAPPSRNAKWFRLIGVKLGNSSSTYPNGDEVQTVEVWDPPDTWAGLNHQLLNVILDDITAGLGNGQRYSATPSAKGARAAWSVVQKHAPDKPEAACREVIRTWMKSGTLTEETYHDQTARKDVLGVSVNHLKRPS